MSAKGNLGFYLARLKNASFPELSLRLREAISLRRLRARFARGGVHLQIPPLNLSVLERLEVPDFDYRVPGPVLESLLAGEVFCLHGDRKKIEQFEAAARGCFCTAVPVPAGFDIRMAWEPARLQHLTILLLHLHLNQDLPDATRLKTFVKNTLLDWIAQNPFLSGPHYQSAMECGLRIPVFFYALKILDNLEPPAKRLLLETVYQHAWWVSRRLSLYSSLGNHTVCEGAGLIFAGALCGSLPEGRSWIERGVELLRQELCHQILDDGGPAEQSLGYHRLVLDLYWLTAGFLEKNLLHDCRDWQPRLHLGEEFLQAMNYDQGQIPAIGDCDDGCAVAPGIHPEKHFAA